MTAPVAPFLHLILHYCNHRMPEREAEYNFCVRKNLNHPFVAEVHNLVEPTTRVPEEFRTHPKYIEHHQSGQWITYKDVLRYANDRLCGKIVGTMNLDTFLDDSINHWSEIPSLMQASIVLCLSRTEFEPDGRIYKNPDFEWLAFAHTQDAWIFQTPFDVPDCEFEIGTLGCDNAFAERIKRTGRIPLNSPNRFRLLHFDRCRRKTAANQHQVHSDERVGHPAQYPEETGQYLLPDIDRIKSVDALLTSLGANELQRYVVICDVLNRFVKLKNR